ncbi:hypothetical protein I307_06531 [Cryptococcus deuterogattii 99/473]|uniref:Uncharacterized protein n=1 Tax=Cryptococcus deuterogattii Ram5 TaxID=1296110 RepID=A0A0D0T4U1_9TREE|nr:hypothetical protein I313_03523 [Cryptococcus deuterogattii Ram5]KIY54140.1 hypothetical protein I307_06531 [Cryptococcus deuterogattii 99/473]
MLRSTYTRWQGAQGLGFPSIRLPTSTNTSNIKHQPRI